MYVYAASCVFNKYIIICIFGSTFINVFFLIFLSHIAFLLFLHFNFSVLRLCLQEPLVFSAESRRSVSVVCDTQ